MQCEICSCSPPTLGTEPPPMIPEDSIPDSSGTLDRSPSLWRPVLGLPALASYVRMQPFLIPWDYASASGDIFPHLSAAVQGRRWPRDWEQEKRREPTPPTVAEHHGDPRHRVQRSPNSTPASGVIRPTRSFSQQSRVARTQAKARQRLSATQPRKQGMKSLSRTRA